MYSIYYSDESCLTKETNFRDGSWIDMFDPTEEEIGLVSKELDIPMDFLTAALDEEERARVEAEDGKTLVILDVAIVEPDNSGNFIYSTVPLAIIACPQHMVTVCLKKNRVIQDFVSNRIKTFSTYKKTRFLLQIMYRNATNYLQCLRQIEKISDSLEKDLLRSTKNKELVMFLSLEKSLVYFSTSLKSNETVLERILKYSYPNIHVRKYEDDEDLLEDAIIENKQAIEMTSIYSSNLSIIMDTSASIISNNLNIVMKLLAAVTIIMAIPNMISGFFGMNFADLPLATVQGAFYIIGAITLVICGIVAFILYKKGMFK